ncbi:hypothetical protein TIFTF001_022980 [Ficus carica]|uniref:F-box domain-containing protein n=1 Tax=Ficus carica TaxID=3494 RepID=A0AA88AFE0_FICCA|nr:hypothetical protein TIFTF001_022980 [Ficus carica]
MSLKIENRSNSVDEVFPTEIIAEEILPRLPLQTLTRFKCVSKLWNSHISSPYFVRHLNPIFRCMNETNGQELFFLLRDNRLIKLEHVPQMHRCCYVRPIGSCNGLTCFVSDLDKITVVWNPYTQQHPIQITAPLSGRYDDRELCAAIGHDARTGDYKVLLVWYGSRSGNIAAADVYSLKTRQWKPININGETGVLFRNHADSDLRISTRQPQCLADGRRIHWLATRVDRHGNSAAENCRRRRRMLMSFDVSDEVFRLMNLPECLADVNGCADRNNHQHVELATLVGNDLVSIFEYDKESRTDYFMWVMLEYGCEDSWTKYKIGLGEPGGKPLGYMNKSKFLISWSYGKVLLYDTVTREKEYVEIRDTQMFVHVGNFMENPINLSHQQPVRSCGILDVRPRATS